MKQFFNRESKIALGSQDLAVLDAYRLMGAKAVCAADLYLYLQRALKRDPRMPTIYKIIVKLRELGLLEDVGEAVPPEGGRPRRLYRLTPEGRRAIDLADRMSATLSGGLAYSA